MKNKFLKLILLNLFLILITCTIGCTSFGNYMKDRGNDFADCFKLDFGGGIGIGAHVIVTDAISGGVGWGFFKKFGMRGRNTGEWADLHTGFPFFTFIQPVEPGFLTDAYRIGGWWKGDVEVCTTLTKSIFLITYDVEKQVGSRKSGYFTNPVDSFDVEASVMLLFIGGRVGFSLGQFVDFILSWFTLDIAKDDYNYNNY